jgi:hypothetical protein
LCAPFLGISVYAITKSCYAKVIHLAILISKFTEDIEFSLYNCIDIAELTSKSLV